MARKKKPTLPRVTVLTYSRKDLAAFVGAVDKLLSNKDELERLIGELKAMQAEKPNAAKKAWETRRRQKDAAADPEPQTPPAAE